MSKIWVSLWLAVLVLCKQEMVDVVVYGGSGLQKEW